MRVMDSPSQTHDLNSIAVLQLDVERMVDARRPSSVQEVAHLCEECTLREASEQLQETPACSDYSQRQQHAVLAKMGCANFYTGFCKISTADY